MVEKRKDSISRKKNKVKTNPFPDIEAKFAHHANFASNSNEVFVTFVQVVPPAAKETTFDGEARSVSRLIFSSERFAEFVEDINSFWKNHTEQFDEEELVNDKVKK